ncbi:hypothetical protein UFOVP421_13 [uncultured Caudovirales phage]|uniref:Uncharacterized protein n=1 Tax=uncultured Caudovirales phage TaxID=2100421 RepID=A0A6J5M587_9CAUD|nr:hypothetical protein UFOVP421_13 [uncultured Caudovirales phage]
MARACKDCGATPDATRFYAGVPQRCAECHKQRVRQNRKANMAYYQAFEAMRYARDYEKRRAAMARYAASDAGKAAASRAKAEWNERNAIKRAAQLMVGRAVRSGKLARPKVCQSCGAGGRIHGHHDDYAKPLEVRWLCTPCHAAAHHGDRAISAQRRHQQDTYA